MNKHYICHHLITPLKIGIENAAPFTRTSEQIEQLFDGYTYKMYDKTNGQPKPKQDKSILNKTSLIVIHIILLTGILTLKRAHTRRSGRPV